MPAKASFFSPVYSEMKIVVDSALKLTRGVFEPFAEVAYLPGAEISASDADDADALIIRTRTRCDATLLDGSQVKIIATATIGYDHIDTKYCRAHDIEIATSAGSNARGVAQYVFAAIDALGIDPARKTLGVIGVGNIGSIVAQVGQSAGFTILQNDPPRQSREGGDKFVMIEEVLENSDILTIHLPLDSTTEGMISEEFLRRIKPGATLINTSRGEIMDEAAVVKAKTEGQIEKLVVDVWRNEPRINPELLHAADIATQHIAGYSLQGRARAAAMAVRAVARKSGIPGLENWYPEGIPASRPNPDISWEELTVQMPEYYDIMKDDLALRADPSAFEDLRNNYHFRPEFF